MKEVYGIKKIKKADSDEVRRIKEQNNIAIARIFESNGYSFYTGLFSGMSLSLLFATLAAFRNDSYIGMKIALGIGTLITGSASLGTLFIKNKSAKEAKDTVNEMADVSITNEVNRELKLRSKNSIKRINM